MFGCTGFTVHFRFVAGGGLLGFVVLDDLCDEVVGFALSGRAARSVVCIVFVDGVPN